MSCVQAVTQASQPVFKPEPTVGGGDAAAGSSGAHSLHLSTGMDLCDDSTTAAAAAAVAPASAIGKPGGAGSVAQRNSEPDDDSSDGDGDGEGSGTFQDFVGSFLQQARDEAHLT
jgi:hypothetical protein